MSLENGWKLSRPCSHELAIRGLGIQTPSVDRVQGSLESSLWWQQEPKGWETGPGKKLWVLSCLSGRGHWFESSLKVKVNLEKRLQMQ